MTLHEQQKNKVLITDGKICRYCGKIIVEAEIEFELVVCKECEEDPYTFSKYVTST